MDLNKLLNNSSQDDIKKLIGLLQAMVDTEKSTENEDNEDNEDDESTPIRTKSRNASSKKQNQKNKFLEMQERHMHKDDTAFQQKVSVHPPVPRDRQFEPIKAKCRVCNKVEQINPALIDSVERYKCNTCASSSG